MIRSVLQSQCDNLQSGLLGCAPTLIHCRNKYLCHWNFGLFIITSSNKVIINTRIYFHVMEIFVPIYNKYDNFVVRYHKDGMFVDPLQNRKDNTSTSQVGISDNVLMYVKSERVISTYHKIEMAKV